MDKTLSPSETFRSKHLNWFVACVDVCPVSVSAWTSGGPNRSISSMWPPRSQVTKLTFGFWVTNGSLMPPRPASVLPPSTFFFFLTRCRSVGGEACNLWPSASSEIKCFSLQLPTSSFHTATSCGITSSLTLCPSWVLRDLHQQLQQCTNWSSSLFSNLARFCTLGDSGIKTCTVIRFIFFVVWI